MKKNKIKSLLALQLIILIYSVGSVFSKLASKATYFSPIFCFYYAIVLLSLAIYAIGWQQIIKKMSLTTAYANKAITIVWGVVWGVILFNEKITCFKLLSIIITISGVLLYVLADKNSEHEE